MKIPFTKTLILLSLLTLAFSVRLKSHKEYDQAEYFQKLQSQQDKFQSGVQKLEDSVSSVDKSLSEAQKIQDKISILQNAVLSQEQSVFTLSSQMIPPLNLSSCNCQSLSQKQRDQLARRTSNTLQKITALKKQLDTLKDRDSDPKYIQMRNNAQNQIFYLRTIQDVLNSQCNNQAVLAPTVYQSNIYANNWILGDQDINSLVQSYIQRSKTSDSITNCPIESPFYNGVDCIQCKDLTPIFNMETKKCIACQEGFELDSKLRTCVESTNYISNLLTAHPWVTQDGDTTGALKDFSDKVQSGDFKFCPSDNPYIVKGECGRCEIGQIYHVELQSCSIPAKGLTYDPNIHSLVTPQEGKQTVPNATNLLTSGDLPDSAVLENCPKDKPFYDGIACIVCPEPLSLFNTATKTCVACSAGEFYNAEKRSCQARQVLFENGNYDNLVGLPDMSTKQYLQSMVELEQQHPEAIIAECKQTENSVITSCVQCADNEVFNTVTLKCFVCKNLNQQTRVCNDGVYFQTNIEAANGTLIVNQEEGLQGYLDQIKANSADAVSVVKCPKEEAYSNGEKCFDCPQATPLFDVSSLECSNCPDKTSYDSASQTCKPDTNVTPITNGTNPGNNLTYVANPGAQNYVGQSTKQVKDFTAQSLEAAKQTPGIVVCPIDTPFSDGNKCFKCQGSTPYFNVKQLKCVACQRNQLYKPHEFVCFECPLGTAPIQERDECVTVPSATNIKAFNKILLPKDSNIADYTPDQSLMPCSMETPFYNGEKCIKCPEDEQFNAQTLKCQLCPAGEYFVPFTHQCQLPNRINSGSLNKVITEDPNKIHAITEADVPCPEDKPFFNGQFCLACQGQKKLFNLDNNQCTSCPEGQLLERVSHQCIFPSSITNFAAGVNRILIPEGSNYEEVKETTESRENVKPCASATPFFNGQNCIDCELGKIFDLQTSECSNCPEFQSFNKETHSCDQKQYASDLSGGNWLSNDPQKVQILNQEKIDNGALKCPENKPFSTGTNCIQCDDSSFDIKTLACLKCPEGQKIDLHTHACVTPSEYITNPETAPLLLYDGVSQQEILNAYKKEKQNNPNVADCPEDTPYFNLATCISCTGLKPYFNIALNICQDCPEETHYDAKTHECMKKLKEGTTLNADTSLEKQLANVFTHKKKAHNNFLHRLN